MKREIKQLSTGIYLHHIKIRNDCVLLNRLIWYNEVMPAKNGRQYFSVAFIIEENSAFYNFLVFLSFESLFLSLPEDRS